MDMKEAIKPVNEPGPTPAPEAATRPARDTRLVDIGGGYHALVWQVLAASDPQCKLCTGGLSKTTEADGKEHTRICGCGPLALRRRIEAMRKGAFVDNGDQFERHARRTELLTRQLEVEQRELAKREESFNGRIAAIEAEARGATVLLQDASAQEIIAAHKMDRLAADIATAEKHLAFLRTGHLAAKDLLETAARTKVAAQDAHRANIDKLVAEQVRFDRDTAGARHDIEKLERRIALARARAAGPEVGETPAA